MSRNLAILIIFFFLPHAVLLAQGNIPLGTWRTHFSYYSSTTITIENNKIYSGSNHGLFFFDKDFNNTVIKSKIDGLSEVAVQKIQYSSSNQTLIIIYSNGNIDLLTNGKIVNVPTIKNSNPSFDKTVHHLLIHNSIAFISTGLGLAVLDLTKKEIREVYQNIGLNGAPIQVYCAAFLNDFLYLSTSEGLKYGNFSATINLQDFNNWKTFNAESNLPEGKVSAMASFNNQLFVAIDGKGIFKLEENQWMTTNYPVGQKVRAMKETSSGILICQDASVVTIKASTVEVLANPSIITPFEAAFDSEQNLWIADSTQGLLKYNSGNIDPILPNGPYSSKSRNLHFADGKIVSLPGGYSQNGEPLNNSQGFSVFQEGSWVNWGAYDQANVAIPSLKDFTSSVFDESTQTWYYGSFQNGLLKYGANQTFSVFNQQNSPLINSQSSSDQVKIADLALDFEGNLWVLDFDVPAGEPSLFVKKENDNWEKYTINHTYSGSLLQILIDLSGQKWLRVNPEINDGGVLVFDEKKGKVQQLNTQSNQGRLYNAQINQMALDKSGYVWLATNNGVSVFYNPYDIVDNLSDATRPIFENQYLLKDNHVTCISIDGGDRKWIGTQNSGVWLFNSDVSKLIYHFTKDNSPIPSNNIIDLAIHSESGEIFIATDEGTVSFRADATEEAEAFSNVKVFPNPIYPGFKGIVGISGLTDNALVKITDVSGKLIFETNSSGGTASWNLAERSIPTGMYFVFSVSENGEETLISKVAVIE